MSQLRQSGFAILFLVAVLMSYSGPAEGGQKTKSVGPSKTFEPWKQLVFEGYRIWVADRSEEFEDKNNAEMRMVGSVVAQRNQYPYMVRSHFK